MDIAGRIRRRGFRGWYQAELLRSHGHLLLLLACALALAAGIEVMVRHIGGQRLLVAGCLLVAGGIGAWALRRYLFLLMRAEHIAHQAVCGSCKAYGRWQVERELGDTRIEVCCRACGHRWPIGW